METFFFLCMLAVLVIRWLQMRARFQAIEARLQALSEAVWGVRPAAVPRMTPVTVSGPPLATEPQTFPRSVPVEEPVRAPQPEQAPTIVPEPPRSVEPEIPRSVEPEPAQPIQPEPVPTVQRTSEDWEALLGGNWLNKIGVFVVVIGLALLLNYAYTHIGPAGRVALSYTGALAMLIAGVTMEPRERYRTFAYGLIGGGWAALYLTTYAMHAVTAARVLDNPLIAAVLLLAVAIGMIAHSLRYRSQTVTGLAYFIAFVTLAIGEVTVFSVAALVPLAASLLYIAHRNCWSRFAVFGLAATYLTVATRGDTGAPLWQTQALLLVYWLLFEGFDLIRPDPWLLPLNGIGFLLLSGVKWNSAAPDSVWAFAAGAAVLYLVGTIVRAHSGRWRQAVTFNAVLATAAIALKLDHQWAATGLVLLAEAYYFAGVRFRSRYLRAIAGAIFVIELGYLGLELVPHAARRVWEPVAAGTALAFYLNRALWPATTIYGYAASALVALVSGYEAPAAWRGPVWSILAVVPFGLGWCLRQFDFRVQAYGLTALGMMATALYVPLEAGAVAIDAALAYGLVQCALRSGEGRFGDAEREAARTAGATLSTAALIALAWTLVPGAWLGTAWLALAVVVFEAGLRNQPREFRWQSLIVVVFGVGRAIGFDFGTRFAIADALLLYVLAYRARQDDSRITDIVTFPAGLLLLGGLPSTLPRLAVTGCWALAAVVLGEFDRRSLRIQAMLAGAAAFARGIGFDEGMPAPVVAVAPAIALLEVASLRRELASRIRLYFSLLASALLAALIYHEVSGSLLTIAWGLEGVALLAAGFPLRDRVLRLSGLAVLAVCTGKLFFWDLRNLDTLPRILSFLVLGLLLVGVSWVYTRFREQVRRML